MKPTYFIRHKWGDKPGVAEALAHRELVGLHYNDSSSTNPADYKLRGASAIRLLSGLVNKDVLVCADYPNKTHPFMLIGPLDSKHAFKAISVKDTSGLEYVIKVAKLMNPRKVFYSSFPVLKATWPRGGTICRWRLNEATINHLFCKGSLPNDVSSLSPAQLEGLCTSYLFDKRHVALIGLPSGGTMKDWDIWGVSESGTCIVAQVTHSRNTDKLLAKLQNLLATVNSEARRIFFATESERSKIERADVVFISLEEVWNHFEKSYGPVVIDRLLGKGTVYPNSE